MEVLLALDPAQKEIRDLRKALLSLSDTVLLYLDAVDEQIGKDRTVPREAGSRLAKLSNELDHANDLIRFGSLGVDYRTDDKVKAVQRLKAKSGA